MNKYQYYTAPEEPPFNKVICVSTFAHKKVRGIAKCSPNDVFDLQKGKHLARLRCDLKIAKKRLALAKELKKQADKWLQEEIRFNNRRVNYYIDAKVRKDKAEAELKIFEEDLNKK